MEEFAGGATRKMEHGLLSSWIADLVLDGEMRLHRHKQRFRVIHKHAA